MVMYLIYPINDDSSVSVKLVDLPTFLGCLPLIIPLLLQHYQYFLLSVTAAAAFPKSSTLCCMHFFLGTVLSGFFDLRDCFLRGGALYKT